MKARVHESKIALRDRRGSVTVEYLVLAAMLGLALIGAARGLTGAFSSTADTNGGALVAMTMLPGSAGEPPQPPPPQPAPPPPPPEQEEDRPWWKKGLDLAIELSPIGDVKTLFDPNASGFDKFLAGASLITSAVPGVGQAVKGLSTVVKVGRAVERADDVVDGGRVVDRARDARQADELADAPEAPPRRRPDDELEEPEQCVGGVCRRRGQCFAAGTLVYTAGGDRPIETLRAGDLVWSRDEHTGELALQPIAQLFVNDSYVIDLEVGGAGGSEHLTVTPNHPFWVEGQGWTNAERLEEAAALWSPSGALHAEPRTAFASLTRVYNFEVESTHTYFVGALHTWVHNKGDDECPIDPARADRMDRADQALSDLQEQFPGAEVGYRGSLARGTKGDHKGGAPFDPENFDVDAFIVSDELAARVPPKSGTQFRSLGRLPEYRALIQSTGEKIKAIPGVRQNDTFKVRVFSREEFERIVGTDERHFVP